MNLLVTAFVSLFSTFLIFPTSHATAQNHWDADFNGLKVKEANITSYILEGPEKNRKLVSTTSNRYYADGKRKEVVIQYYDGEKISSSSTSIFIYRNDSIVQIVNKYFQDLEGYGVDSGITLDVPVQWHTPFLSQRTRSYEDIHDYYAGEPYSTETAYQFDKANNLTAQHVTREGQYEMVVERKYDSKGQLIKLLQSFTDLTSDEVSANAIDFNITASDKNGWTTTNSPYGDEVTVNERKLVLYTKDELNNSANFYKELPPYYTLKGLLEKLGSLNSGDSITAQQFQLMNLATNLLESNPDKMDQETAFTLVALLEKQAAYHFQFNDFDKSIQAAEKGLKQAARFNLDDAQKFRAMLSFLYEKKANHKMALQFYTEYYANTSPYGFDPLGNYKAVRLAELLLKNNQKADAMEILQPLMTDLDKELKAYTGKLSDGEEYDLFSFFGKLEAVAAVLEKAGEFAKAGSYLQSAGTFYEKILGKDDITYLKNQENLQRVTGKLK